MRHLQKLQTKKVLIKFISIWIVFLILFSTFSSQIIAKAISPSQDFYPQAEVIFKVALLNPIPDKSSLALEIVDDVTGLAFNPTRYEMIQQDDLHYFVKLPLVIGSILKYRYVRLSDMNAIEYTTQLSQVRYRIADITGPALFQDNIIGWIDQPYSGPVGRARGQFIDKSSNAPIPNLLVTAEGIQTITASDGTFILEGLSPGTHNLVAYSMDGKYATFQQGMLIAEEATTPVFVYIEQRTTVKVTFEVSTPNDFDETIPLRFASNLQPLGNLYADLDSGSTTISSNLPVLQKVKTGKYSISIDLPVGFDLRYKFTLGDGLWNCELDSQGNFVQRELLVSKESTTIKNTVSSFKSPNLAPIIFNIITPTITPNSDLIFIQFNPFGWFEPLPMVKISDYQWRYTLYTPLNLLGPVEYRFCRNEACETTSAVATSTQYFIPLETSQNFDIKIDQWSNFVGLPSAEISTDAGNLSPRPDFLCGYELVSKYSAMSQTYLDSGFEKLTENAANTVIIPSTWTATRNSPPYLEPLPGYDYSWTEMQTTIIRARQQGLNVILFPQLKFPVGANNYWESAKRDEGWWISWFERYHRYIMQVADWATLNDVNGIILGDPMVSPANKGGKLADGSLSNSPANADEQWRQLVQDVRSRFSGSIIGAYAYPNQFNVKPNWLDSVDQIYVLYSPTLTQSSGKSVKDLVEIISADLETNLYSEISEYNKMVIIGINYPSSSNAYLGCNDILGSCMNDWSNPQIDLLTQSQIYNSAIISSAKEPWIIGFISRNYQPVVVVYDSSSSINGKPAMDVLWFWFHYLLNISP